MVIKLLPTRCVFDQYMHAFIIMLVSHTDDATLNSLAREKKGFAVQDMPRDGNHHQAL